MSTEDLWRLLERVNAEGTAGDDAISRLVSLEYDAIDPIRAVLKGADARWKANVLGRLVTVMPKDVALELAPDLLTLAMNPSEDEIEEGVDELAEEILSRWL